MDVTARTRFVRLSPLKARDMVRRLPGMRVADALRVTEFSNRKAALQLGKTLRSAIANARENAKLDASDLIVKQAVVEEGPRLKRHWSRARGSVSPIRRRMCHIRIVVTDGREQVS
ncbi:MAG: 50S ribosomal protein L22 [Lentisphaerae bacterium RIFOXYC12_FULL_60_16]|nr:MAG: 50S ribosomal protein L22 [Lentisphaerae bacterium RIFOXYC12_FULL_60_16]OGV71144.1 MAG: 50S ribosomal protein L22 [Lentisphaerae bacterium RIFOXYA12_FULL_60_10]OGV77320.1 MAG: 50S ribosomal protein L22 [Lentisphaerae bacterium RIFOXYB12_FULL_60_10]